MTIKLINTKATLNNFFLLGQLEYVPGETLKVNIHLVDTESKNRLIPGSTSTLDFIFQKTDGTELTKTGTLLFGQDDRSMWTTTLTDVETAEIIGSNFKVELDFDGAGDFDSAIAYNVLHRSSFDGEC